MKAGIIAEGRGDHGVITNILKGVLGIDRSEIQYLVPELDYDETDMAVMRPEQFSSWTVVREKCLSKCEIEKFLETPIDDKRFLVIHLDTAERFETHYDVLSPPKIENGDYVASVRQAVKEKIQEWLDSSHIDRIAFAIAVEETDAWVLTIYEDMQETGHRTNPKEKMRRTVNRILNDKQRRSLSHMKAFQEYSFLSEGFRKMKNLKVFRLRNKSLDLFCEDLESLD